MKNLEKRLTFRLDSNDLAFLQEIAEKQNVKVSYIARKLVIEYLSKVRSTIRLTRGFDKPN